MKGDEQTGESAPVPPIRIVISYRRQDTPGDAHRLHESLARHFGRENVFLDIDSIPPGSDWRESITKTVSSADVLLLLIGLHWLTVSDETGGRRLDNPNDVLRFEIELALKQRVRMIPIQLHGAAMPSPNELPESLNGLTRRQSVRIDVDRWTPEVKKLIRELKAIKRTKAESRSTKTETPRKVEPRTAKSTTPRKKTTPSRPLVRMREVIGGRYELEELVGSGGRWAVYRARDRELGRKVALKILQQRYGDDGEYVERFRREVLAVARLAHHPNIVPVFDYGEDKGRLFIVCEYIEGDNLKQIVERGGPLPIDDVVGYGIEIAQALVFAHERGIVHRDVTPQNILVNGDAQAKVTDFGIVSAGTSQMTEVGPIMSTAQYLSPEHSKGAPVDQASDLYSLGIVLYELLTGKVPFATDSPVEIAMKHVNEPAPSVLERRPDAPPALAQLVGAMLEKDRALRPSMQEVVAELEALREPSRAEETVVIQRPRRARAAKPKPDPKTAEPKSRQQTGGQQTARPSEPQARRQAERARERVDVAPALLAGALEPDERILDICPYEHGFREWNCPPFWWDIIKSAVTSFFMEWRLSLPAGQLVATNKRIFLTSDKIDAEFPWSAFDRAGLSEKRQLTLVGDPNPARSPPPGGDDAQRTFRRLRRYRLVLTIVVADPGRATALRRLVSSQIKASRT